jgi:hypothetical protein
MVSSALGTIRWPYWPHGVCSTLPSTKHVREWWGRAGLSLFCPEAWCLDKILPSRCKKFASSLAEMKTSTKRMRSAAANMRRKNTPKEWIGGTQQSTSDGTQRCGYGNEGMQRDWVAAITMVGGPLEKMSFFQIAYGPILSIPIYSKVCQNGLCKFLLKKMTRTYPLGTSKSWFFVAAHP